MGTADAAATAKYRAAVRLRGEMDGRIRSAAAAVPKPATAMIIQKGYRTAGPSTDCDPNGPVTPSIAPNATALSGTRHFLNIRHSRIANRIRPPVTKRRTLFTILPLVDRDHDPPTGRHEMSKWRKQ
eukprot:TRINITY_DN1550_c0_g1_i3.p1 TRINITY_DN1550_c0_g1~~TRINITY_DN1550_c0_g1_i3.p1  ORF type:complete len:143 (-),score=16.54 TRINITY_DN1550_c0_g1_i3:77-457(-)